MFLNVRKTKSEYLEYIGIFSLAVLSGVMISFYNLSVLFLLALVLFVTASFRYFNHILLLLILYIPFQVALNISAGVDLASGRVFILYLFAVWAVKSLAEKRFVIRLNLQTLLIFLFLSAATFSILQAWDTERALRKILVFLSIFPLYFIVTSLEAKKKRVLQILDTLVISGFVLSLVGIAQFLLQFFVGIDPLVRFWSVYISPLFYGKTFGAEVVSHPSWLVNINGATIMRAFSLFPDPHMFSFYLGILIPIVLAAALVDKNSNSPGEEDNFIILNKKALCLILLSMFLAELFTFSRGGYIGMISGVGVTVILLWRYIDFNKKIILGLAATSAILFILFGGQSVVNRFLSSFDFSEGSNAERIKNWREGWEVFSDNLVTGVGIGNYSIYLYPTAHYRTPIYAHNLYLDIGAEMGVFALAAWLALVATTVWQLYEAGRKNDKIEMKALTIGLIGSLVWFSAHSFFDTPIYSPTILAMFVIVISLSVLSIKFSY